MANKKISDYTEALSVANDDFFEISVDAGGGSFLTRKVKKSNMGIGGSPLTTKGDVYTFDTADARLPVGTDGQALLADSAEATGLRWGTPSVDNMATADLTLTADRFHELNSNELNLLGDETGVFKVKNSTLHNINPTTANGISFYQKSDALNYIKFAGAGMYIGSSTFDNLYLLSSGKSKFQNDLQVGGTGFIGGAGARLKVRGSNSLAGTYTVLFENSGGSEAFRVENDRQTYTKRLNVKGLGSTNATTALLVENSSGTELFKILDDGTISGNFPNFANTDLTLTADRDHNLDGNKLTFKTSSATSGYLGIRNSETTSGVECLKIWSEFGPRYTYINNVQSSLFLGGNGDLDQLELGNGFAKYKSRVIIIPSGAGGDAHLQVRGASSGTSASTKLLLIESNASGEAFKVTNDRQTYAKRLNITGTGGTSATTALLVENSSGTEAFKVLDDLAIIMANLPTSSSGLATGQLWNNSGVVNIV